MGCPLSADQRADDSNRSVQSASTDICVSQMSFISLVVAEPDSGRLRTTTWTAQSSSRVRRLSPTPMTLSLHKKLNDPESVSKSLYNNNNTSHFKEILFLKAKMYSIYLVKKLEVKFLCIIYRLPVQITCISATCAEESITWANHTLL